MRKHVLGFGLALACTTALAMGAFASDVTVEEVLEKYNEAGSSISEMNCTAGLDADIAIVLPDLGDAGTFAITANGMVDMSMIMDPVLAKATTSLNMNVMGEETPANSEAYISQKEDGSVGIYVKAEEDGEEVWQYMEFPAEQMAAILGMVQGQQIDLSTYPVEFALADEKAELDDSTCYVLTATLTWSDLSEIISSALNLAAEAAPEAMEQLGSVDDILSMGEMFLGGLMINIEIYVDDTTYLPMMAYFDTEGSDWTVLGALFAQFSGMTKDDGSLMDVDINVNSLYLVYNYDYDTPVDITIPDEAIAAEENGVVLDEDLASALLDSAEGELGLEEAMTE